MVTFLEELRTRFQDAQRRLQLASQKLQIAQAEHQSAVQEFASYQKIIEVETRKLQQTQATNQAVAPQIPPQPQPKPTEQSPIPASTPTNPNRIFIPKIEAAADVPSGTNKTEAVRELLRRHPAGMTPAEVWNALKNDIAKRDYVYSILKRLKDAEQAIERRGKYYFRVEPKQEEEAKNQATYQ